MSYEPTVWKTGDTVTSEKLNKLENGVANAGGGATVFQVTTDSTTSTRTVQATASEINDAFNAGVVMFALNDETNNCIELLVKISLVGQNEIRFVTYDEPYVASSPDEKPHTIDIG